MKKNILYKSTISLRYVFGHPGICFVIKIIMFILNFFKKNSIIAFVIKHIIRQSFYIASIVAIYSK